MDKNTVCKTCQRLEDFKSGRMVGARCPATGITFPALGVKCKDLCTDGNRSEISHETFSCSCYLPKVVPTVQTPRKGVRVENGLVLE